MRNGRCELHGGRSTGARTPAGRERARGAAWKNGKRSRRRAAWWALVMRLIRAPVVAPTAEELADLYAGPPRPPRPSST